MQLWLWYGSYLPRYFACTITRKKYLLNQHLATTAWSNINTHTHTHTPVYIRHIPHDIPAVAAVPAIQVIYSSTFLLQEFFFLCDLSNTFPIWWPFLFTVMVKVGSKGASPSNSSLTWLLHVSFATCCGDFVVFVGQEIEERHIHLHQP